MDMKDLNMTFDEMFEAVIQNDESCDGRFFYAVKSTGIYCRPSCKSRAPKAENVEFFRRREEASAAGYRACKRCRSDLADYKPSKEMAEKLKILIDEMFVELKSLNTEIDKLGLSRKRMVEVFKEEYGLTPGGYVNELRYKEAKRLLEHTQTEVIDIAFASGFSSMSAFYKFFKERAKMSPAAYRKGRNKWRVL